MTTTRRDVLYRGYPVTLRLCELPGFEAYLLQQRHRLTGEQRGVFRDWLVVVDAEQLEQPGGFGELFAEFLERTRSLECEPALAA